MGLKHHPRVVTDGLIYYLDAANTRSYSGSGLTANELIGGIGGIIMAIPIGNLIAQGISSGNASFIIPWLWMTIGIIICILVGLFSGIYPAYKASEMDPVEALRYE